MDAKTMNPLTLAYLGDSIYELYIRRYLIEKNIVYVKDLQVEAIKYVQASSQAKFLKDMMDKNFLSEEELQVMRRARNYKCTHHPKNCDLLTYKHSTAFEAIIGYLDMNKDQKRIEEIIQFILEEEVC